MVQINEMNMVDLRDWYVETPSTELVQLDNETLGHVLEELTPYERKPWHSNAIMLQLLEQWFQYEETWEVYPISRKEMFMKYKSLTGQLPELSLPTLTLFNHFIKRGVIH